MPQRNLGDRDEYMIRVAAGVKVKSLAAQAGYSDVSRYGADMFAMVAGRPDLLLGLRAAWVTYPSVTGLGGGTRPGPLAKHFIRVSSEVNVKRLATTAGYSNVSRYGADLFAVQAGRPDLVLGADLITEEDMLLPISA